MPVREEKRNLNSIPVGSLGIVPLEGCKTLGDKVDAYLVKWRTERESEHKNSLAFSGYQRDSYIIQTKVPRFGTGEAKGVILESVRGDDLYFLVDVAKDVYKRQVDDNLDHYRIPEAARALQEFVDEMSNWYVRRSRERFWAKGMEQDKINAYMTLYTALVTVAKAAAPMIPFMTEDIYQNLVKSIDASAPESIHLCDFPEVHENWIDPKIWLIVCRINHGAVHYHIVGVSGRKPVAVVIYCRRHGHAH